MAKGDPKAVRRLHVAADGVLVSLGWVGAWWLRHALDGALGTPHNPTES